MARFYANPYDTSKSGFYFDDEAELEAKLAEADFEEYKVDCINFDNERIFNAFRDEGKGIDEIVDFVEGLDDDEITAVEYLIDRGYDFDSVNEQYRDVIVFRGTAEEYAEYCVDENLFFGETLSDDVKRYIDFEAIARDLECGGDICEHEDDVWIVNANCF